MSSVERKGGGDRERRSSESNFLLILQIIRGLTTGFGFPCQCDVNAVGHVYEIESRQINRVTN